jgi:hypothetical protein
MAEQAKADEQRAQPHGVLIPFNVMCYSLSEAICALGIPTLEMGLAAANSGLVKVHDMGEGTLHFEWDKKRLDKHSVKFLETLLINLRDATGVLR